MEPRAQISLGRPLGRLTSLPQPTGQEEESSNFFANQIRGIPSQGIFTGLGIQPAGTTAPAAGSMAGPEGAWVLPEGCGQQVWVAPKPRLLLKLLPSCWPVLLSSKAQ